MKQETELESLGRQIAEESAFIDRAREVLATTIIGQSGVIDKVFIALLANGHLLLEGVP
ncbi:MAG: ATPase, partial [Chlorobaculum sp.]|nr:ATPase [Chlorobaculum sp.]